MKVKQILSFLKIALIAAFVSLMLVTTVAAEENIGADLPADLPGVGGISETHECGTELENETMWIIIFASIGGVLVILTVIAVINSVGVKGDDGVDDKKSAAVSGKPPPKKRKKSGKSGKSAKSKSRKK
jgi:hypothetical protein